MKSSELVERIIAYLKRRAPLEDVYHLAASWMLDMSRIDLYIRGDPEIDQEQIDYLFERALCATQGLKKFVENLDYDEPMVLWIKKN